MTEHLSFEMLCDYADGALDTSGATAARAHLAACAECDARYESLTSLTASAAALPKAVAPPDGLWADIRGEITSSGRTRVRPAWGGQIAWLAAAAVIIAIGSSALTLLVMRGAAPAGSVADAPVRSPEAAPALPARLASSEVRYSRDVEVLQRTLAERRDSLAPSTVETIERSLRVADSAIAEARAALTHDPSNAALAALFASNYERKIDLLKRATELTPRT